MLGVPYIWGGNNPMTGLDCSGFIQIVLKKLGYIKDNQDRTAQDIFQYMSQNRASLCSELKGDCLLFFGKSVFDITHIALSIDSEWMIEAAHGGSQVVLEQHAIDKRAKVEFNRINRRKDLVIVLSLNSKIIGD